MRKKSVLVYALFLFYIISNDNPVQAGENDPDTYHLSAGARYFSRFTSYGINLAGESQAWGISAALGHFSGFYTDVFFTRPVSSPEEAWQWTFDIGYEKELSSWFSFSAEFSHFLFSTDTINIFSGFSNLISLGSEFDLKYFDLGISYDRFLGGSGATYISFDFSTFHKFGSVYILPVIQMVFVSQTVEESYLVKGKGKKKQDQNAVTAELTGLANTIVSLVLVYPVLESVSLSFVPTFIINHENNLSGVSSSFMWNSGIRYKFNF